MDTSELAERFEKARAFIERLESYINGLRREIEDLRKVAFEIATMIISDTESIRDELVSISKRILQLEKKK